MPYHRAVLAAVNTASRRLWRWPPASVDRRCARRASSFRPGRRNGPQPNRETSLQTWLDYFAELDAHNLHVVAAGDNRIGAQQGICGSDEKRSRRSPDSLEELRRRHELDDRNWLTLYFGQQNRSHPVTRRVVGGCYARGFLALMGPEVEIFARAVAVLVQEVLR